MAIFLDKKLWKSHWSEIFLVRAFPILCYVINLLVSKSAPSLLDGRDHLADILCGIRVDLFNPIIKTSKAIPISSSCSIFYFYGAGLCFLLDTVSTWCFWRFEKHHPTLPRLYFLDLWFPTSFWLRDWAAIYGQSPSCADAVRALSACVSGVFTATASMADSFC